MDEISSDTEIELRKIALQDEEIILGVYENRPQQVEEMVAISTYGLYLFKDERWHPILYDSIEEIQVQNAREKLTASVLLFRLKSGQSAEIPIMGGTDRTRDIWSFKRFFDRVIKDVKR